MLNFKLNVEKIRKDFPILNNPKKKIIYFDNACMSLKPVQVIEAMNRYYNKFPGCAGRSTHQISKMVDFEVEKSREIIKKSFNARKKEEIIFTKNTTEGINIVANSLGLKKGDIVVATDKEHNSNLVPWQMQVKKNGIIHKTIDSNQDNSFSLENFQNMLNKMNKNVKLVTMVHSSNLDGTIIPAKEIIKIAHENGSLVLLDGAQSAPHKEIDFKKLDVDFFSFSGHKMLGPTAIGVLYGKYDLLEKLVPYTVGGETVFETTYTDAVFEKPPQKFEPGLQHYSGIIGLGEAFKYIDNIGRSRIEKHEVMLNKKLSEGLLGISSKIKIIGPMEPEMRSGITSFNIEGMDPHAIAIMIDKSANICIRSGAHCVHSWFNKHNMKGSARASLYLYNTEEEVETFIKEMQKIIKLA